MAVEMGFRMEAGGPVLGQRNNQRCQQVLSLRRPQSTMIHAITTIICVMTILPIITSTNMTIMKTSMMMAIRFRRLPMITGKSEARVVTSGHSIQTIPASLSWRGISQKLNAFCRPMWRTPSPLPCRPTARCELNC